MADDGLLPVERLVFPKLKRPAAPTTDPFVGSTPWSLTPVTPSGGDLLTFPDPVGAPVKPHLSGAKNFLNKFFNVVTTPQAVVTSTLNELTDLVRQNGDASFADWLHQMTFDNHIYGQDLLFGKEGKPNSG